MGLTAAFVLLGELVGLAENRNMGFSAYRVVILLVCIVFLAVQPEKVDGLKSIDLALKWDKGQLLFLRNSRILNAVAVEDLPTKPSLAPAPSMMFDPNQSDKRRVRRGSDPIHNRC
ncbi:hypothetical protein L1049_027602 [Liquidambar formosana]|uniref:Uncharacterized protein n=1 Tax=Liquidambar formosana TaxID=63359 RepID=A0AAP0RJF1_LIQFO